MTTPTSDTVEQAAHKIAKGAWMASGAEVDVEPFVQRLTDEILDLLREQREAARREGWKAGAEAAALEIHGECRCSQSNRSGWGPASVGQEHWGDCPIATQQRIRALPEMKKE